MHKAPTQHSVRPTDLFYKGRRIFIPANSLGDHPGIVDAVSPNAQIIAQMVKNQEISCIPDDQVIAELCRDLGAELVIDANTELAFADPTIVFEELDADEWDDQRYSANDPTAMDSGSLIFRGKQLGFQRMVCHVSHPFWFPEKPEKDDQVNNSLRVKTSLYCNKTPGVQNFIPVMPYIALFTIPKLWIAKRERVLSELKDRLITLYREAYEVNLSRERSRLKEKK
jgi:hypothetical protein